MSESRNLSSKHALASSFGKAAAQYDRSAHLQKMVGNRLLESAKTVSEESQDLNFITTVVDLGCGTGYFLPKLDKCFAPKELLAVDLSEDMLRHAQSRFSDAVLEAELSFIESDAEEMSLENETADLVFSSLALQWVVDIGAAVKEAKRVLRPGGYFTFSTLLDGTLTELKSAWAQVDDGQHVNDFLSATDYEESIRSAGLELCVASIDEVEIEYDEALALMRDLKAIGAHNISQGRPKTITSPGKLKRVVAAYEHYRKDNGMLPAHYTTGIFIARKPRGAS